MKNEVGAKVYWNEYYDGQRVGGIPSQFAAFVLSEFADRETFVDIGCGNGRDSFFFAAHGKKVLGADASASAIKACREGASNAGMEMLSFEEIDFSSDQSCEDFVAKYKAEWSGAVLYARFFIHAIDAEEERRFLALCASLIGENGAVCLEFRTNRDENQKKVTASHYRRFVNPVEFITSLQEHGLKVDYFCDGFGMAKYKADDAHVVRFLGSSK